MLGKEVQITCTATNDQDAPMNLMFSWMIPNNNKFIGTSTDEFNITTTDEDGSRTATSILHISTVTLNHRGKYKCLVRNGNPMSASSSKTTAIIVEGKCYFIAIVMLYAQLTTILQNNHHHLDHSTSLTLMLDHFS